MEFKVGELLIGIVIGLLLGITARWIGKRIGKRRQAVLTICAWCGKEMRRNGIDSELIVSHGICPECKERYFPNDSR